MKTKIISKILLSFCLAFVLAAAANANSPPVVVDDFYGVDQLASLSELAPGVLVNDTDPDTGTTLTAALVTGPSHARSFQLNSDGSFTYVPVASYYGPDTFTYHAYDSTIYSATGTVNVTVRQPCSLGGFVTGGGNFLQSGRKCTFGFVAKTVGTTAQGNFEFHDQYMGFDVKAPTMGWVYAPDMINGYFSGACSVNNIAGYSYFVQVHDHGQPGSNDDFSVWIYDPSGAQIYTSFGLLSGGNILIHDDADGGTSREWWCDADADLYYASYGFSCTDPGFGSCTDVYPGDYWYDCEDDNSAVTNCI